MFRCPFISSGFGYGQPHSTTKYHRNYSGEHVTNVAQRPGAVLQHQYVAPANRRYFDNYPMNANNAMAANHHGGGLPPHRYGAYEETYQESSSGQETTYVYAYGGGGCAQLRRPFCCP